MSNTTIFNTQVRKWTGATRRQMKLRILQLVVSIGPGHDQQKTRVRYYLGEANRIQFSFPYYMVFVHKGAGRGYGGGTKFVSKMLLSSHLTVAGFFMHP